MYHGFGVTVWYVFSSAGKTKKCVFFDIFVIYFKKCNNSAVVGISLKLAVVLLVT